MKRARFSWHLVQTVFSSVEIEKFLEELHSLQKKKVLLENKLRVNDNSTQGRKEGLRLDGPGWLGGR